MRVQRRRRPLAAVAGALLLLVAVGAGILLESRRPSFGPRPSDQRPELLLLTSLPIVFPESLTLDSKPAPALKALQGRYRVVPISLADSATLRGHRLLLMAQPQAQPAEVLVQLDQWVRGGGRVLLLADPALEWPSEQPLGSALRLPLSFPDTGLLGHWGLRMDAPDALGGRVLKIGSGSIKTAAPGALVASGSNCRIREAQLVAHCRIGRGSATVIADADFINSARAANLDLLLGELDRLER